MKKLTKMQQKVYDYIAQFMTKWGYPPSVREICAELNFKSPSTAHFHILNLEKKGYLEHDAGKGRAIRLKGEAQTAPAVPAAPAAPSNAVDFMEERDARENRIPIVGNVAAGSPILAQECVEDYLTFDTGSRSGEFFALRVRGESMLGVGILPDDLVVVRRQQTRQQRGDRRRPHRGRGHGQDLQKAERRDLAPAREPRLPAHRRAGVRGARQGRCRRAPVLSRKPTLYIEKAFHDRKQVAERFFIVGRNAQLSEPERWKRQSAKP